jgi:Fur family peroxide stress response transcriptional regulator
VTRKKDEPIKILRDRGMRITPQRIAVLQAVEVAGNHPDAETVYQYVCGEYPRISRDTVYRILSVMEEEGIIGSVLNSGSSKRFDPNTGRHHHLICVRCKTIVDFTAKELDHHPPLPAAAKGFKILRTTVNVEVVCKKCLEGEKL